MEARDHRAFLKNQLALKGLPTLSLTLNIPGYPKSNATVKTFFDYCLRDFKYFMKAYLVDIIDKDAVEGCDAAGDFYFAPCGTTGLSLDAIKQYCEAFEQNHPLGRFIDADLNDQFGNTVSSGKSKICFFCLERPAIECRRENTHEPEELRAFMFPRMEAFSRQQRENRIVKKLSSLAQLAILDEISLSPKPGLVDKFSSGSHTDMNYRTFLNSTSAIAPWFAELVQAGFTFEGYDLTRALPLIRRIGLSMETAMNESTRNVNTQKGIIFLMGLALFSCGRVLGRHDQFTVKEFRMIVSEICRGMVRNELQGATLEGKSHGMETFLKYGFSGARGEAESGFETVFNYGLPQLNGITELNDQALINCFLAIASNNIDTNILYRSNPEVLGKFQKLCKMTLEDFTGPNYSTVMDFCNKENISPGGSADLLAVTIFVWSVINTEIL